MIHRSPPIIFEFFLILFSLICFCFSIPYTIQLRHARTWSNPPDVSWSRSGGGAIYGIPPGVTLLLSILNFVLYHRVAMPLVYGVIYSTVMCAMWIATIGLWIQCHVNLFDTEDGFCYQRNLVTSDRFGEAYRGVSDQLANAGLAFAVLCLMILLLYVITAAIDFHRGKREGRMGRVGYGVEGVGEKMGGGRASYDAGTYTIAVFSGGGSGDGCGGGDGGGGGGGGDGGGGY